MSATPIPPLPRTIKKDQFSKEFAKFKTLSLTDIAPTASRTVNVSHQIRTLAWSPLGNLIATGSGDTTLRVWNPERPEVKYSTALSGHSGPIERVAFNPSKIAELATCSADGAVKLWDVRTRNSVKEIKFAEKSCFSLAWHPLGEGLLLGRKVWVLCGVNHITVTPNRTLDVQSLTLPG